jgi:hypothetical protein
MENTKYHPTPTDNRSPDEENKNIEYDIHQSIAPSVLHEQDAEKAIRSQLLGSDAPDGGVFQEYYQDKLLSSYSSSTISWIPSLQIFFIMGAVSCMYHLVDTTAAI